jgi:hypothetical protein
LLQIKPGEKEKGNGSTRNPQGSGLVLGNQPGVLMLWFLVFVFARDFVFGIHTRWFKITKERFDEIHYTMMGYYKLIVFVFNVIPYLALRIVV